jgi:alkylated DNA repair dioxygenase AlkB
MSSSSITESKESVSEPIFKSLQFKSSYWNVVLIPDFLSQAEASSLFFQGEALFSSLGKIQKRRTNVTLGDRDGMTYKVEFGYGKTKRSTTRQTIAYKNISILPDIKSRVEKVVANLDPSFSQGKEVSPKVSFPMCAALRYPNGNYGIKRHRDREVPSGSIIAGLSVGEKRTLILSDPKGNHSERLDLTPGSLYIFYPPTNDRSFHEIEEEPKRSKPRISFTFRTNWTPDE